MGFPRHALFAAVVLTSTAAYADKKPKVAIVSGLAVNVETGRADALAQDLAEALAQELEVDTVGGLAVRRKLPEQLPPECVNTPACIADVAQRLQVDQLLFVVFVDSGTLQMDSTWVDVATGKSIARTPIDVASNTDAKEKFAASATMLLPDAKVRVKAPTTIVVNKGGINGKMSDEIPRHLTPLAYATAGVALVGLGVGIGFGLKARTHYNDCEASLDCGSGARDGIRHVALGADIGYFVALAGAAATVVLWATSGKESHLIVTPEEHGAMVGAFGRF